MSITDQQFETILVRLESGESLKAVQADFPHLEEDIAAMQDLQDFFAAQRLRQTPSPEGLRGVLRQVQALQSVPGDDEFSWGRFFTAHKRWAGVAFPALMVMGVSGYLWQQSVPLAVVKETDPLALEMRRESTETPVAVASLMAPSSGEASMDMAALVESLSEEFASDMAEFETTRNELEPYYAEELFSYAAL